ncbi:DUF6596 domain-containing protein [Saccharothrix deserti]|uniref:DUF6596 domain-containing protein n=1 Tax=Saccharothrix deserti TaxID=2593674 RepID=UPI00131DA7D6|nr:DUF6596 domain-containing protein [Saccharothrix deserti]
MGGLSTAEIARAFLVSELLALMLLHDSRRDARIRDGEIVPLHEQDRLCWIAAAPQTAGSVAGRSIVRA